MEKVFEIYIKTTPERLWGDHRPRAALAVLVRSGRQLDWKPGSRYEAAHAAAGVAIAEGENLEVAPPHRLVQSFNALWSDEVKAEGTRGSPGRSSRSRTPAG